MNPSRSRFAAPRPVVTRVGLTLLLLAAALLAGALAAAALGWLLGRDLTAPQSAVVAVLSATALLAIAALWGASRQRKHRLHLRNLRDSALW